VSFERSISVALGCCLALLACRCTGRKQPDPAPPPEPPAAVAAEDVAPGGAPELGSPAAGSAAAAAPARVPVRFETQVRPILERCRPCHFEGGKMYARLPFDQPETVLTLGEKLFTRIHADSDQAVIRAFLAQERAER
jgi:hypothetical protein